MHDEIYSRVIMEAIGRKLENIHISELEKDRISEDGALKSALKRNSISLSAGSNRMPNQSLQNKKFYKMLQWAETGCCILPLPPVLWIYHIIN